MTINANTITDINFTAQNIIVNGDVDPLPLLDIQVKLVYVLCEGTNAPFTLTKLFPSTNLTIQNMSSSDDTEITPNQYVSDSDLKDYKPGVIIRKQDDDEVLGFFVMKTDMKDGSTTSHPLLVPYTDLSQNTQFSPNRYVLFT